MVHHPARPWAARAARLPLAAMIALTVALGALAGCGGATPIKSILDDPSQYMDRTVTIAGHVTSSAGLLEYGAYQVNDGTGSIAVVSSGGGAPREGAEVVVEGRVKAAFTLGTASATVMVEERRKTR